MRKGERRLRKIVQAAKSPVIWYHGDGTSPHHNNSVKIFWYPHDLVPHGKSMVLFPWRLGSAHAGKIYCHRNFTVYFYSLMQPVGRGDNYGQVSAL